MGNRRTSKQPRGKHSWAVRRWTSNYDGKVTISGTIDDTNRRGGGDGITGRIFHNDKEIYKQLVNHGSQANGYEYRTSQIRKGDTLDFAIDYNSRRGRQHPFYSSDRESTCDTFILNLVQPHFSSSEGDSIRCNVSTTNPNLESPSSHVQLLIRMTSPQGHQKLSSDRCGWHSHFLLTTAADKNRRQRILQHQALHQRKVNNLWLPLNPITIRDTSITPTPTAISSSPSSTNEGDPSNHRLHQNVAPGDSTTHSPVAISTRPTSQPVHSQAPAQPTNQDPVPSPIPSRPTQQQKATNPSPSSSTQTPIDPTTLWLPPPIPSPSAIPP